MKTNYTALGILLVIVLLIAGGTYYLNNTSDLTTTFNPIPVSRNTTTGSQKQVPTSQKQTNQADISKLTPISKDKPYAISNGQVYAFVSGPYCAKTVPTKVEGADVITFEYLGGDYAKDKNHVYDIFDGDPCDPTVGPKVTTLSEADPSTFKLVDYSVSDYKLSLGIDSDSVYFGPKLLSGIDPSSMTINANGNIIKDQDTVWVNSATNCESMNYTLSDFNAIKDYIPRC